MPAVWANRLHAPVSGRVCSRLSCITVTAICTHRSRRSGMLHSMHRPPRVRARARGWIPPSCAQLRAL